MTTNRFVESLTVEEPERQLTLGAVRYVLRLEAADAFGCEARITLAEGARSQLLYQGDPAACDEPHFEIVWSGDLDRDGRIDLVTTSSPRYSMHPRRLWLSSPAGPGRLVEEAARYERTAM